MIENKFDISSQLIDVLYLLFMCVTNFITYKKVLFYFCVISRFSIVLILSNPCKKTIPSFYSDKEKIYIPDDHPEHNHFHDKYHLLCMQYVSATFYEFFVFF